MYNADHPGEHAFVVRYDDFNPYLDRFRSHYSQRRKPQKVLARWKIWDHIDAILSLGTTQLVDRVLRQTNRSHPAAVDIDHLPADKLTKNQQRDLLLLCTLYDQSSEESQAARLGQLRRKLKFRTWMSHWDIALGIVWTLLTFFLFLYFGGWRQMLTYWPYLVAIIGWFPRWWRMLRWCWKSWKIVRNCKTVHRSTNRLRRALMRLPESQLTDQPLPLDQSTDHRYTLLAKLQNILSTLGFPGMLVLIDRIDEPYMINGSPELMRMLAWPLFDNKLLKHPSLGFKLLLPSELGEQIERESREFHERARLDKQNLIRSLSWTPQSLLDVANSRLAACSERDRKVVLGDLFDESVPQNRITEVLGQLRVPRHMFKFLYRVLVTHANAHSEDSPAWRISSTTFESVFSLYQRDREAFERGTGVV